MQEIKLRLIGVIDKYNVDPQANIKEIMDAFDSYLDEKERTLT